MTARLADLVAATEGATLDESFGQAVIRIDRSSVVELVDRARGAGFTMFLDLCAVDYLTRDPRFEVVVHLRSLADPGLLRIKVGIPGDDPTMPSLAAVFPGANFYEREAFDLFGIEFVGHPDLTRILLPDEWEGHPLRKDTAIGSIPVQFKEANRAT